MQFALVNTEQKISNFWAKVINLYPHFFKDNRERDKSTRNEGNQSMLDFVVKYWVEFFFGLVVAIGGFMLKHHFKLFKNSLKEQMKEHDESIVKEVTKLFEKSDTELTQSIKELKDYTQEQIDGLYHEVRELKDDVNHLRRGVLDLQGPQFKVRCRELLEADHHITIEEWEAITSDYEAYTGIGGNSDGCTLYESVKHKYEHSLEK